MLASLFTQTESTIQLGDIIISMIASLILGLLVGSVHMFRNTYTKNFVITLVVLPILVQSVIMLVNGNLGTGIAVMGAFSLIRFRSVAGGSRDLTSIFWSMAIGLATGMGYVVYITILSVVVAAVLIIFYQSNFGVASTAERELKITIAEDLDYPELFTDVFEEFTHRVQLESVRTTTMGSLYELRYIVLLKDKKQEKTLIDTVRVRNGNLPVVLGRVATQREEL